LGEGNGGVFEDYPPRRGVKELKKTNENTPAKNAPWGSPERKNFSPKAEKGPSGRGEGTPISRGAPTRGVCAVSSKKKENRGNLVGTIKPRSLTSPGRKIGHFWRPKTAKLQRACLGANQKNKPLGPNVFLPKPKKKNPQGRDGGRNFGKKEEERHGGKRWFNGEWFLTVPKPPTERVFSAPSPEKGKRRRREKGLKKT